MAKNNMMYKVVVYVGGYASHDTRVIYTAFKESKAEQFLHEYLREHPEVCKAYIERSYERSYERKAKRDSKYAIEDED